MFLFSSVMYLQYTHSPKRNLYSKITEKSEAVYFLHVSKNAARSRTTLNTTIIPFLFRRKDTTSVSHSEIFRRKSAWKICTSFNVKGFGGVGTAFKFRFEKVEVVLVDFLEGAEEFVGGHLLNLFLDFWREGREQVVAGAELDEIH